MPPEADTLRHQREAAFHDKWAGSVDVCHVAVKAAFEAPTAAENRYILTLLGDIAGKSILDLGCGLGDATVYFAERGARVCALDISQGMVELVHSLAEHRGMAARVSPQQGIAEALPYKESAFDFVYGNGILHHVDFLRASQEVYRVLKPGGRAAFIEPLTYNPAIWVYRALARAVRTEDEHPLSARDIQRLCSGYLNGADPLPWQESSHREFQLTTLLIMVWFLIGERVTPSRERYWKRFIDQGERYRRAFELLYSFDQVAYAALPVCRWLSWNSVITLRK